MSLTQQIKRYLHYGPLLKWPRRMFRHLLTLSYPIVKKIWKQPQIHSIEETILEIQRKHCSIARFGDGEMLYVLSRLSLPFQHFDQQLADKMRLILKAPDERLLVGLPDAYRDVEQFDEENKRFWKSIFTFSYPRVQKLLDLDKTYWNANITRLYYGYKDHKESERNFLLIRGIWQDRDVVLIEGEKSRLGVGNDLFGNVKSLQRILGPAHHAFSRLDDLKSAAMLHPKDCLLLIAMGPTAKVLSYELTLEGYQCVDIGNLDLEYEWYKRGVKERIIIPGKYTSEVAGGRQVADVEDASYHSQIIAKFL